MSNYSESQYVAAMKMAKPCDCGSTNLAGPPHVAVVCCGDCGRSGKPALNLNWHRAVDNWNTWPKVGPRE